MSHPRFSPGFRFSIFDAIILAAGATGVFVLASFAWQAALIVGAVVLHFFLFCNVFRISRLPELIWAVFFVAFSGSTILTGFPGWFAATGGSAILASFLIWKETRKQSYHGVFWERWNPGLAAWWEGRHSAPVSERESEKLTLS